MKMIRRMILNILLLPLLVSADEGRVEVSQADLPLTISTPGSYLLTGNLSGAGIGDAITISTHDVTLDLNGFQMSGDGSEGDAVAIGAFKNIILRNGIITGWGGDGVNAASAAASVFQDLISTKNTVGLRVGNHCRVINVTCNENSGDGIRANDGSLVRNCVVSGNGSGASGGGIVVNESCIVLECIAFDNLPNEIQAERRNRIERNLCDCNGSGDTAAPTGTGIKITANDNLIRDNHVTGCGTGYDVNDGFAVAVSDNIVIGNSSTDSATEFDIEISNLAGEEVDDLADTNNVNAANGYMNTSQ